MKIKVEETSLEGVKVISLLDVFEDFRGDYVEIYNKKAFSQAGVDLDFIQDDYATSRQFVLRGVHGDDKTAKLIKCIYGSIYLVAVNNDPASKQFRKWLSFDITSQNRRQVLVPPKFGIGYLVMSDIGIFHYKQTTYYGDAKQFTIKWDDKDFDIWWPAKETIRSFRDS